MEFLAQALLVVVIGGMALALCAIPGFLVGGALGLVVRRIHLPGPRIRWSAVCLWALLCAAGTVLIILPTETDPTPNAFDAFGVLVVAFLGVASAAGGSFALYRTLHQRLPG
jgi:O-antigen/teichoic acid export membrane protein